MSKKSIQQKPNRLILIKRYIFSAITLYGVIKLDDFINLFNHYEKESLTKEEAIPILELLDDIDETFLNFKNNIIGNAYFCLEMSKDMKKARDLLRVQEEVPRYLPSKEEFLKYHFHDYIESIEPLLELKDFIIKNQLIEYEEPDDVWCDVIEIHELALLGMIPPDYLEYINDQGYRFKDQKQLDLFYILISNVYNNTRIYQNHGHTPIEVEKILKECKKTLE